MRSLKEKIQGNKKECIHTSLLSQNKGVVIDVFICKLHKSVDLPFTHKSAHINRLNSVGYGPGNPEWCPTKGMVAAELAELSMCVHPPPPRAVLILFLCIMVLHKTLYVEIKGSTSLKRGLEVTVLMMSKLPSNTGIELQGWPLEYRF